MQAAEYDPLTVSHRPNGSQGRWATPQQIQFDDTSSVPQNDDQMIEADDPRARPVKPAELAQAQVFEIMLQAELARLSELANRMAGPRDRLRSSGGGTGESHRELREIHARIDEVRRLLNALRDRFLRTPIGA